MYYTMKETCEMVNMTYEALKYYCNVGLIPNVKRDKTITVFLMKIILIGSRVYHV